MTFEEEQTIYIQLFVAGIQIAHTVDRRMGEPAENIASDIADSALRRLKLNLKNRKLAEDDRFCDRVDALPNCLLPGYDSLINEDIKLRAIKLYWASITGESILPDLDDPISRHKFADLSKANRAAWILTAQTQIPEEKAYALYLEECKLTKINPHDWKDMNEDRRAFWIKELQSKSVQNKDPIFLKLDGVSDKVKRDQKRAAGPPPSRYEQNE